jgi:exopolysaccharide production protein ExoZ
MGKIREIQHLRAVAASLVVFAHLSAFRIPQSNSQLFPDMKFGNIGVDIFFVISGFVMTLITKNSFGKRKSMTFILERIVRIAPLYWLITILVIKDQNLEWAEALNNLNSSTANFFGSIFFFAFPKSNNEMAPIVLVGWTLWYEMFFYFLFSLALRFKSRYLGFTFLFALITVLSFLSLFKENTQYFYIFYSNPIILEFLFGIIVCLLYEKGTRLGFKFRVLMIFSGVMIVFLSGKLDQVEISGFTRVLAWGIPAFLFVSSYLLRLPTKDKSRILSSIGNFSYSTYLIHIYVLQPPNWIEISPAFSPWLYSLFTILNVWIISFLFFKFIEQPCQKLSRKLF